MTKATEIPTPEIDPSKGSHQPFSWLSEETQFFPLADLAILTKDLCGGLKICLEILEADELDRNNNDPTPLLGVCDSAILMRHAIAVADLLGAEADRRIEWINDCGLAHLNLLKKKNS